jgi:hypothetical protein
MDRDYHTWAPGAPSPVARSEKDEAGQWERRGCDGGSPDLHDAAVAGSCRGVGEQHHSTGGGVARRCRRCRAGEDRWWLDGMSPGGGGGDGGPAEEKSQRSPSGGG